jgi:hypothetical protein
VDLAGANDDVWRDDGGLVRRALAELPAARRHALILRLADRSSAGSLSVGLAAGIGPDALSWGAARHLAGAAAGGVTADPDVLGAVAEVTRRETGEVPAPLVAVMRRTAHWYSKQWPLESWPRLRPWLEPYAGVLSAGEPWVEAANAQAPQLVVHALAAPGARPAPRRAEAVSPQAPELVVHALAASGARPAPRWARRGAEVIADLGGEPVRAQIRSWFALVPRPRTIPLRESGLADPNQIPDPYNARALRGLVYLLSVTPHHPDDVGAVGRLAQHAAEKVPGHGPRSQMVAHACVYALERFTTLPALRELARLRSMGQPPGIAAAVTGAIARRTVALNIDPAAL